MSGKSRTKSMQMYTRASFRHFPCAFHPVFPEIAHFAYTFPIASSLWIEKIQLCSESNNELKCINEESPQSLQKWRYKAN